MTDTIPETAHLTADVVALGRDTDGRVHVLLIRRRWAPFEGCWALPGGHVDQSETDENAAHRELAEETGIRVGMLKYVGAYREPGRDPRGRYVTFAYATVLMAHLPPATAADDAVEARWVPVSALSSLPLAFDHRRIIDDALKVVG